MRFDVQQALLTIAGGLGTLLVGGLAYGRQNPARIVAPGVSYQMTWTDLLWLARATACESSSRPAEHAWLMIQRFVAQQQNGANWPSLELAVRRFSSPVNDRWLPGGDLYQANPGARASSPDAQALRSRCMIMSWESIARNRPDVYRVIRAIAAGTSSSPVPLLTNFRATSTIDCTLPGRRDVGGNCFIVDPPLRGPVRLV